MRKNVKLLFVHAIVIALLVVVFSPLHASDEATFVRSPTAKKKSNGEVEISFEVSKKTDIAVYILDREGNVIRHLVAGMIGENPPAPLKPNSLSQTIVWDGKADYGEEAKNGPFQVKVALRLKAKYAEPVLSGRKERPGGIKSIATGSSGTVYMVSAFGASVPNWSGEYMVSYHQDGTYRKTLIPPPADFSEEEFNALGIKTARVEGKPIPLFKRLRGRSYFSASVLRKAGMAVTSDNVILTMLHGGRIGAIRTDGKAAWGKPYVGPRLQKGARFYEHSFMAVSGDGKQLYVTGLTKSRKRKSALPVVYRVPLPERDTAEVLFGDPGKAGADNQHLGKQPRGIAVDGKGHLLVADYNNNRIVVISESDGSFVGSFEVKYPNCVAVNQKTGAVYVTRGNRRAVRKNKMELVKYSGWKDPEEKAKTRLRRKGNPEFPWVMAIDSSGDQPVVWLGWNELLRVEDNGNKFSVREVGEESKIGNGAFAGLEVAPRREDPEIYARCGRYRWMRYNEKSGKIDWVRLGLKRSAGTSLVPSPDGKYLYAPAYASHLYRFDREGNPAPWEERDYPDQYLDKDGTMKKIKPHKEKHSNFLPVSMTYMTHTLGVRYDNRIFALVPGQVGGRPPKMLHEYLPSGKQVTEDPIIWKVSDTAVGPEFDAQGNIYIADQLRPKDQPYPEEFKDLIGEIKPGKTRFNYHTNPYVYFVMYGSILKFDPEKGGMIHYGGQDPFKGEPDLDDSLKTIETIYSIPTGSRTAKAGTVNVTGAKWIHMGMSHVALHYCNCENSRFDVDPFGRVWYPDLGRYRVSVIDTNGNPVTHFGGYGNVDNHGPDSQTKDSSTSDLAFAWLAGVGVTDDYAYMGDSLNRRLSRAKLTYQVEETCEIK